MGVAPCRGTWARRPCYGVDSTALVALPTVVVVVLLALRWVFPLRFFPLGLFALWLVTLALFALGFLSPGLFALRLFALTRLFALGFFTIGRIVALVACAALILRAALFSLGFLSDGFLSLRFFALRRIVALVARAALILPGFAGAAVVLSLLAAGGRAGLFAGAGFLTV